MRGVVSGPVSSFPAESQGNASQERKQAYMRSYSILMGNLNWTYPVQRTITGARFGAEGRIAASYMVCGLMVSNLHPVSPRGSIGGLVLRPLSLSSAARAYLPPRNLLRSLHKRTRRGSISTSKNPPLLHPLT